MIFSLDDTIAAIASAPGAAPRGVIRLSGDGLRKVLERAFPAAEIAAIWNAGRAVAVEAVMPLSEPGEPAEQSLAGQLLVWPSQQSYTRQTSAEFHLLGAPVLLSLALKALCAAGARLAQPGEFTLRAFLAGRIDLTQAEAVLGMIDAESSAEFQVALKQSSGGLAVPFRELRERLADLVAELEATLDFIDQDIEFISRDHLLQQLEEASTQARSLEEQIDSRGQPLERRTVVLAGQPNAGKSSLFNYLVGSEQAIISSLAGTTRDSLCCQMEVGGQRWELFDTAGLDPSNERGSRDSDPQIEIELAASTQTLSRLEQAEIVVWCVPARQLVTGQPPDELPPVRESARVVQVATQSDLLAPAVLPSGWLECSAKTGQGVDLLLERIVDELAISQRGSTEVMPLTARRCGESIRSIVISLDRAREAAVHGWGEELIAAELRVALDNLGEIAGTVYNDEILGRIFSRFCIGK